MSTKYRLVRPSTIDEVAGAFKATLMCLRDDTDIVLASFKDSQTRWYANRTQGYVRFVRRRVREGEGASFRAWLLDVSYTSQGRNTFHHSSVGYLLEASDILASEKPREPQFIYSARRLARLLAESEWGGVTSSSTQQRSVTLHVLPPITQPICKYRYDDTVAEEFSNKRVIPSTGVFYRL
jgi:hypothetical protein